MSEDNMDFLQKPVPPLRTRLVERFKSQPFIVIGKVLLVQLAYMQQ